MASLRILCAMLLVSAGLAHQPVAAKPLQVQDLAIYVLPDGSVADLCVPGGDGQSGKITWHGCEACRIASGILIPAPPVEAAAIERQEIAADFKSLESLPITVSFGPGASPRGPPEFLV
ncbi:hypothetical protein IHQ71_05730 [Rhizobium sp. TH2]|uniref:hypothetical protein n=1 Tax=Rhizobium sp. TH2 TaxID=2775403 RepID=UPI0021589DFA|nr:hypothetical protein [Rhizobium sp. TH2]UVC10105.1 hypothetical protein IHQ71_05730 [Rhizobium sp. TH2]